VADLTQFVSFFKFIFIMAVLRGNRIVKGKLGDVGHRQQFVKEPNGSYKKRTVAYQLPVNVTQTDSVLQDNQRSKFKLIQALSQALTTKGFTRTLYRSGIGIGGYQAFIRDNIKAVVGSTGNWFLDFSQVRLSIGDFKNEIKSSRPLDKWLTDESGIDVNCQTAMGLCWSHDANAHPDAVDYQLLLVGVKVNEDGSLDDIITHQPLANMSECNCQTLLPLCGCCKTYWYAMFVNPNTGRFSSSTYLGSDAVIDQLPEYNSECCCATCDPVAPVVKIAPPSEVPVTCCGTEEHNPNRGFITFSGENTVVAPFGAAPFILVPEETINVELFTIPNDGAPDYLLVSPSNPQRVISVAYAWDGSDTFIDITNNLTIDVDNIPVQQLETKQIVFKVLYSPNNSEYTFAYTVDALYALTPA
jgi:hypothetical protein